MASGHGVDIHQTTSDGQSALDFAEIRHLTEKNCDFEPEKGPEMLVISTKDLLKFPVRACNK